MSKAWNRKYINRAYIITAFEKHVALLEQYTIDKQPVITSTRSVCTMFKSTSWIKSLKF